MRQSTGSILQCVDFAITSSDQFREALVRLRFLEKAPNNLHWAVSEPPWSRRYRAI
ncbi:MAG: hypothetical protein KME20_26755 [Kaiparowitsia implicata GSE-PSE-MK54-09C]|jgi:hypothetical protein|nr:hypothetical protein [Kaiparowitsia implicata GSE-PSE-MK54-09C]